MEKKIYEKKGWYSISIPSTFVKELKIQPNEMLDVDLSNGKIIISKKNQEKKAG